MVSPSTEQIDRHISVLEDFERTYREYLVERRSPDHGWSAEKWARRGRSLKEPAPQVEAAMVAAGARRWDEGPMRIDLPARRILRFVDEGAGIDDTKQWDILEEMPTHIGSLKEKRRFVPDMGLGSFDTELPPNPARVEPDRVPAKAPWGREHLAVLIVTASALLRAVPSSWQSSATAADRNRLHLLEAASAVMCFLKGREKLGLE